MDLFEIIQRNYILKPIIKIEQTKQRLHNKKSN